MIALYVLSHHFVLQISDSLPCGIYIKKNISGTININQLVLHELSPEIKTFMIDRQWIPGHLNYYLMKPIAAKKGDHIKVNTDGVYINNEYKGPVKQIDQNGQKLPQFIFNGVLEKDTYFLLAPMHNSFDSRYFGPVHRKSILAIVEPFIVFP